MSKALRVAKLSDFSFKHLHLLLPPLLFTSQLLFLPAADGLRLGQPLCISLQPLMTQGVIRVPVVNRGVGEWEDSRSVKQHRLSAIGKSHWGIDFGSRLPPPDMTRINFALLVQDLGRLLENLYLLPSPNILHRRRRLLIQQPGVLLLVVWHKAHLQPGTSHLLRHLPSIVDDLSLKFFVGQYLPSALHNLVNDLSNCLHGKGGTRRLHFLWRFLHG
mmetsp:Transcript_8181/g.18327  ORF Transcript_8181/g.18327 Transcript_8181/m.18327 type:complete len:217 (-) Transcript_8181:86-736(-)